MSKTLDLDDVLTKDNVGVSIANKWMEWNNYRRVKQDEWNEVRSYVFAVDTSETSNSQLPWKNKTTVPKLCQIRDNLYANYVRSLFPKRKWVYWEPYDKASSDKAKKKTIEGYMNYVIERSGFKDTVSKLLLDWIDYGNAFVMPYWCDDRVQTETQDQVGYVGPKLLRISPLDIVFNPTAPSFSQAPKIVRSIVTLGEAKEQLESLTTEETREDLESLWKYMMDTRETIGGFDGELYQKDELYQVDGFDNYQSYIASGYVEILTFYGDFYNVHTGEFYKNHVIKVVDRHKVLSMRENPSLFGTPQIFHVGWRIRQDNLWAMGPLDNLVGMQYRIDHLENLKADVFDLIAFPPIHIKGQVEDFEWGPFERIYSDTDGEVNVLSPETQALSADLQIAQLEQKMEEMAGAPKEAMGFRTPGEKTMYEVQRLENAAGRIFQSKIELFEENLVEPLLSSMLELGRRKSSPSEIPVLDEGTGIQIFLSLTPEDITGNGRIRPVAARNFAEKAEKVQNVSAFFQSAIGQDPGVIVHFSGINMAKMMEDLLDLEGYNLVQENVRIAEQADTDRMSNSTQESVAMEAEAPGLNDIDPEEI